MQIFRITFGKGKEAVQFTDEAVNMAECLNYLQSMGWEIHEITKITKIN